MTDDRRTSVHPGLDDVRLAERTIRPYLARTPLLRYPALDALVGAEVYVKREDCQPTSAFKVRGGLNVVASLTEAERARGVICASTGNLGQGIAYAAKLFGARCIVAVPENANAAKVAGTRAYGPEIVFHGANFDEARAYVEQRAAKEGLYYIHSANEPLLVTGVATESLEVLEDVPDLDYLFVPLGGGSGAAGASIVARGLDSDVRVVAVQSAEAPAGYESWKQRRIVEVPTRTEAEGLATATGYALTQELLWEHLDGFILVDDSEMRAAVGHYFRLCHALAEYSAGAALAGVLRLRDEVQGKKVALILTGANITAAQLQRVLAEMQE